MVRGAICGDRKSRLVIFPIHKVKFAEMIHHVYQPVLLDFYRSVPGAIFMEDNAQPAIGKYLMVLKSYAGLLSHPISIQLRISG